MFSLHYSEKCCPVLAQPSCLYLSHAQFGIVFRLVFNFKTSYPKCKCDWVTSSFFLTSVTLMKTYLRWLSVLCLPFKPSLNTFTQIFFPCRTEKDRYVTKSTYVQCHWLREAIDFGIDCTDRTWPHVPIKCVQHHASASPSPSRLQLLASCSGLLCSNACLWRTHRSVIEERAAGAGQEVRK